MDTAQPTHVGRQGKVRSRWTGIAAIALAFGAILAPDAALPDPAGYACPQNDLTVFAVDPDLATRVCDVAAAADPMLTACGLPDYGPLRLYVVKRIDGPPRSCLGVYVVATNEIAVIDPTVLAGEGSPDTVFNSLPVHMVFDSLVVHEMAHARLANRAAGRHCGVADHEYVAHAMQIAWLPAAARETVLAGIPEGPADTGLINEVILSMSPRLFAGLVWRHFSQPEQGCEAVRAIAKGTLSFERSGP